MAISGIELSASVLVGTTKPVDAKYGPYAAASLSDATDLAKTNSCKDDKHLIVIRRNLLKCIFSNMVLCHARRIHTPYYYTLWGRQKSVFFPLKESFLFQICLDLLST